MSKPRVFVTRLILESGLNLVRDFCEADIWPEELPPSRQAILEHVHGMDGLLCLLTDQIDAGDHGCGRAGVESNQQFFGGHR